MKKILLFLMTISSFAIVNTAKAQCDLQISNFVYTRTGGPTDVGGTNCSYKFDASFDIITNSGFKYLFFHSWKATDYPSPSVFDCTKTNAAQDPGTKVQLGTARNESNKSFLDLGFIDLNTVPFVNNGPAIDVTNKIALL